MSDKPREYTKEEIREKLLKRIWLLVDYWENESRKPESRDKLSGLAFSILSMLDGSNVGLPGFALVPSPHESDKEYLISQGENYFPFYEFPEGDIGGSLHDDFYKFEPK